MNKKIEQMIKDLGWNLEIVKDKYLDFSIITPKQYDFHMELPYKDENNYEEISLAIKKYAENYSVDEMAEFWIDGIENGQFEPVENYDIIYDDMAWIKSKLEELISNIS